MHAQVTSSVAEWQPAAAGVNVKETAGDEGGKQERGREKSCDGELVTVSIWNLLANHFKKLIAYELHKCVSVAPRVLSSLPAAQVSLFFDIIKMILNQF